MATELTTVPTETVIDPAADFFFLNDVSETPDAINKAVLNDILAAFLKQGADVASAAIVSLAQGSYFNLTGTTTITDIDFSPDFAGRAAWCKAVGIFVLTHNATTLICPTGANITTAAGDTFLVVSEGADVVRIVAYFRASGAALAGGLSGTADNLTMFTSPTAVGNAPGIVKAANQTLKVTAQAAADVPLTAKMAASPTANGFELRDSADAVKAKITKEGYVDQAADGIYRINGSSVLDSNTAGGNVSVNRGLGASSTRIYGSPVFLGTDLVTYVNGNGQIVMAAIAAPATAAATGTAGEIRWDASFIYICTAANTWKRVGIATW